MPNEPKKLTLNKTDTAKDIIAQLIEDEADEVILVVPKFSQLIQSGESFKLLKKAAAATGKRLSIESVDDQVVQLAKAVELEAINPFFASDNNKSKSWQDIEKELEIDEEKLNGETWAPSPLRPARARGGRRWLWLLVLVVLAAPLYYVAFKVLPRAEVKIVTKKADWSFNDLVAAEKNGVIPTEVIAQKKNAQLSFPATGKKVVSQKAAGKIMVFNAFSSEPQQLVATTRFVTPEGKIFRLTKSIVIPGAKVIDNQITASAIEAEMTADKPGADYNLASGARLTIPGFKGTAKYRGFYGESKEIAGGKIGEVAYPTEEDIKKSKNKIASVLEEALSVQLPNQLPPGFKLVEGGQQFFLVKATVNPETNEAGEFSLIAEGELTAIGFREKELIAHLENKMKQKLGSDYQFKKYDIKYDVAKVDFDKLTMSLPVDFKAIAYMPVNAEELRKKIAGKSEKDLREIIFGVPGLASAEVSLWPIYVRRAPASALKILVD